MSLKSICERCNTFNHNPKTLSNKLCNECLTDEARERELIKNYNLIKKRLLANT